MAVKQAGISSLHPAMFDELDEDTAIFKVTRDPPVGASPFVAEPDSRIIAYGFPVKSAECGMANVASFSHTKIPMTI